MIQRRKAKNRLICQSARQVITTFEFYQLEIMHLAAI